MSWDLDLAKQFKKRDNPNEQSIVIGSVVRINPLVVSICDNTALLGKDDLHICNKIQSVLNPLEITFASATFTMDGLSKTVTNFKAVNPVIKLRENIFSVGDKLLLVTGNNQNFIIVDIISEVV